MKQNFLLMTVLVITVLFLTQGCFNDSDKFDDLGNGVVRDKTTGLEWQQGSAPGTYDRLEADKYCNSLLLGTKNDWRLPSMGELKSLVSDSLSYPSINTYYFPDTKPSIYWSSFFPGYPFATHAWGVEFATGTEIQIEAWTPCYVRCVSPTSSL